MKRTRIFTNLRLFPSIVCPETNWNLWSFKHGVILPFYSSYNPCTHPAGKTYAFSLKASEHLILIFYAFHFLAFQSPRLSPFSLNLPSAVLFTPLPSDTSHCLHSFLPRSQSCAMDGAHRRLETPRMLCGRISQLSVFSQGWGDTHCNSVLRPQKLLETPVSVPNGHPAKYSQRSQDIGVGFW